jgi:hypothetical protein
LAFEQTISLDDLPVLRSHVIDGRLVLPLALHLELLAHAALHANPGYVFHGANELRLLQGVVLENSDSVPIQVFAGQARRRDDEFVVPVEIRGRRGSKNVVHSRAEVVLIQRLPAAAPANSLPPLEPYSHAIADAYRRFLFHGADLQGIGRIEGVGAMAIVGTTRTSPAPFQWLRQPLRSGWIADPLAIDAAFQMMILWSFQMHDAGSLPAFVGRYRQFRRAFPAGPIGIAIGITHDNGSLAHADIDFTDAAGVLIARIENCECVIDAKLREAFGKNAVVST